jgi:serine phosphatase RsbU (regulator of sigma subunit)
MEVQFAVAKVGKYATSESGDTLEMIERPHGGLSFILADGQRSGKAAKAISNVVARKAVQLLGEGVRDGAVARAAHDYLYTYRGGKVSATLNILSIDAITKTFVISRNNDAPVIVHTAENGLYQLDEPSERVGVHRRTKPVITEIPIVVGTIIVVFTDGLQHAGKLSGDHCYEPLTAMQQMIAEGVMDAYEIADTLLQGAYQLDKGRPHDDISVLVISVREGEDRIRRLNGRITL